VTMTDVDSPVDKMGKHTDFMHLWLGITCEWQSSKWIK